MGAQTEEVSVAPHLDAKGIVWGLIAEGAAALLRSNGMGHHWSGLYNPGLVEILGKFRQSQANDFPPTVKLVLLVLLVGTYMSERYHGRLYAKAQNLRRGLRVSYDQALSRVDLLAMPTTPMKAHRYEPDIDIKGLIDHGWNMLDNTAPFDMTGHPAISIPCGMSNGLPVGMMLVGRHFDEATIFRAAHAFENQVNWETL